MSGRDFAGPAGSQALLEENRDLPLVHVQVALRTGGAEDPLGQDGLTNFASELMSRGAADLDREQLDAAFDALGSSLDISTGHDEVHFGATVLCEKLPALLALLSKILLEPRFPTDEADQLKREIKAQLDDLRDDDGRLARRFFEHAVFGDHPYGRTILGREPTLDALTAEQARAWHARSVVGGNLIFGFAGDARPAEIAALLTEHFSRLPTGESPAAKTFPSPPKRRGCRLTLVDKPERSQSQILIGHPAIRWSDPDFFPLHVGVVAFGGTFTSRLMDEVRVKRGLSYGARARISVGRHEKLLLMHVFPSLEQTPETLGLVLDLYRTWAKTGLTAAEIDFAKSYLSSSFAFQIATPEERLELRSSLAVAAVAPNYISTFAERIRAVTPESVHAAMARHLQPDDLEICIVSTASELSPALEEAGLLAGLSVEIVPHDSY